MIVTLIMGALVIGSVYSLIAIGYSLIYSSSGLMTFCQGELMMFGAFLGLTFYTSFKLPFVAAIIMTVVIMFIIGLLMERFLIRTILNKHAGDIYIVLATIALAIVLQNLAQHIWGAHNMPFPSIFGIESVNVLNSRIQPESFMALAVALLSMGVLHMFMTKMKFGTSMRAAAMNPLAARSVGINVGLTTGISWGVAASLAGIAGVLLGPVQGVSITMGSLIGIKSFAAAVIGGYGNMYGAVIGGFIIGFIETFGAAYITSDYKDFITFGLLALCMVFMPRGILKGDVYDR